MTPQERELLTQFLNQLAEARAGEKNAEAEALIREAVARQPDAAYLLVQRTILQEQALNAAKTQIAQLQNQLQNARSGNRESGFLGGGNPWSQASESPANASGVPGAGNYQVPRAAPAANVSSFGSGGGGGSFLGNIATTAAGVVAGSFLFQGIENLLGHHQSPFSSPWGDSGREVVSEETIINNYYDSKPDNELARNDDDRPSSDDDDDLFAGNDDSGSFFDDGDDSSWV